MSTADADREEGVALNPRFDRDGLIVAIAVDAETGAPLMQAFMNAEALRLTLTTGQVHYWSRSRNSLWKKGETSGHTQALVEALIDCDQDSLWLRVRQTDHIACHTGRPSCYYRRITPGMSLSFLESANSL